MKRFTFKFLWCAVIGKAGLHHIQECFARHIIVGIQGMDAKEVPVEPFVQPIAQFRLYEPVLNGLIIGICKIYMHINTIDIKCLP